ncbi:hypothetical protein WG66_016094 [Moniliophthora roreri]|uniref:Uncharacterized protein n=1 Tax=Moniliophthora roreri TaxID=221103 RepID=A0A0W0FBI1_MONRR|nr:hypothetical protein WG66_016094 [Moniliophthora roreri]
MSRPSRSRSIDLAIHEVTRSLQNITVSTVLPIYIRVAGFDSFCPEAIIAFEHAMDKGRLSDSQFQRLRDEYWMNKLGGCKDKDKVCQCSECGGMRLQTERYLVAKAADIVKVPDVNENANQREQDEISNTTGTTRTVKKVKRKVSPKPEGQGRRLVLGKRKVHPARRERHDHSRSPHI